MTAAAEPDQQDRVEQQLEQDRGEPAAQQSPSHLFQWSGYIHVGPTAEECPDGTNGKCENPHHFHAWCRLPNQFQQRDIVEKCQAAKARRIRLLRDPDTDAHEALEGDLREIAGTEDTETVIQEIVEKDWQVDFLEASKDVEEMEEFANYQQDREEFQRLRALPEDQRGEEFEHLTQHILNYSQELTRQVEEKQKPKKDALADRSMDELITMIRNDRIEASGTEAYMHTYSFWSWFVGTLKPVESGRPKERVYKHIDDLRQESEEVIDELKAKFEALHSAMAQRGALGNS